MSTSSGDWSQLLVNKVIFITGGAGYIAKSIAKTCYLQGARLVLSDLVSKKTSEVKEEIISNENNTDDRILLVQLDVTNEISIQQAVQITLDKWKTLDVLLNTVAVVIRGDVEEVSGEDWSRIFDINVSGYALMAKHIAPVMKKQNNGSIVNIASTLGLIAIPNTIPYSTTKGLFDIRVNSISPSGINNTRMRFALGKSGGINKNQVEESRKGKYLKRICKAEELADLFIFLPSDVSPFMTGANLLLDGVSIIV